MIYVNFNNRNFFFIPDPVFLIMEYIMKGKLQSYLRDSRTHRYYNNMHGSSDCLTSQNLTSFCYQIAKGMQYLSSKGVNIISLEKKTRY